MIVGSVLLILIAIALLGFGLAGDADALLFGSIAASLLAAVALYVGARQAAAGRVTGEPTDPGRYDTEPVTVSDGGADEPEPALVAPAREAHRSADRPYGSAAAPAATTSTPVTTTIPAQPVFAEDRAGPGFDPRYAQSRHAGPPAADAGPEYPPPGPMTAEHVPAGRALTERAPTERAPTEHLPAEHAPTEPGEPAYDEVDPPDEPAPQPVSAADAARVAELSVDVLVVDGRPRYHVPGCAHLIGREIEPLPVGEAVELGFTPCGRCEPDSALLADARRV